MITFRSEATRSTYVQAWLVVSDTFDGFVYDPRIALDKFAECPNATVRTYTIVRHDSGERAYLEGAYAGETCAYQESLLTEGLSHATP